MWVHVRTASAHIKLRILADKQLMSFEAFVDNWCISDEDFNGILCVIDLFTDVDSILRQLEASYYVKNILYLNYIRSKMEATSRHVKYQLKQTNKREHI